MATELTYVKWFCILLTFNIALHLREINYPHCLSWIWTRYSLPPLTKREVLSKCIAQGYIIVRGGAGRRIVFTRVFEHRGVSHRGDTHVKPWINALHEYSNITYKAGRTQSSCNLYQSTNTASTFIIKRIIIFFNLLLLISQSIQDII